MKRFTETQKWVDPWFRTLPPAYKSIWQFLCDNCDNAGFWKVDLDLAAFQVGCKFNQEDVFTAFNTDKERIDAETKGYWFLREFVFFQHTGLNPKTNLHAQIIVLLKERKRWDGGLYEGYVRPNLDLPEGSARSTGIGIGIGSIKRESVRERFTPPSIEDITAYCQTIGFTSLDAKYFVDRGNSNGWVDKNGNKYKDWKAVIRTWKKWNVQKDSDIDKLFK